MGIEPTEPTVDVGPNGFEDRGRHQTSKHFLPSVSPARNDLETLPMRSRRVDLFQRHG